MGQMTLTSDDLNYLIFRYLQESGFVHTAFAFAHESSVSRTPIDPNKVPPGSLVLFVQKGLQYLELEANYDPQEGEVNGDFTMLSPQELITKDVDELRRMLHDKKGKQPEHKRSKDKEKEKDKDKDKQPKEEKDRAGAVPMEEDLPIEISSSSVLTLDGHDSEVFICAWSPSEPLLASGSGDSTARIWNLHSGADHSKAVVLRHQPSKADKTADKSKDVTTLDWNSEGSLLATGSYDGLARVWSKDGDLRQVLSKHKGPIFSLKWNKKGDLLLSGSVDKTAIIWDAKSGDVKQQFECHSAPTLDVDWRNNNSFATCSTDKMIYVCKLGDSKPLKSFSGHADEVNAIKWDPQGRLLASCSDDCTAKIWSLQDEKCRHDLRDHTKEIYTIKWSPTGPGTTNPNQQLLLASASFDSSVKLWDVEVGRCLHSLLKHTDPVYSVAFSPNGRYVATGSFDRNLHIWNVDDGQLVRTFKGQGGIFEVCWNRDGDKVAACFSNKTVCVVDFRM